jgi:hypothetical protein
VERVEQLEMAAEAAERQRSMEKRTRLFRRMLGELMRQADETLAPGEVKAEANVLGSSAILTLRARAASSGAFFNSVECHVTDAQGRTASAVTTATLGGVASVRRFSLSYPRQFADAHPLEPGTYQVEWRRRSLLPGLTGALAPRPVVATTTFTVSGAMEWPQADRPESS